MIGVRLVAVEASKSTEDIISIDLRDPLIAGFLAWLIPGAGHFYQRRWAKGFLFMICILATFFSGLFIGKGRVVYASMRSIEPRPGLVSSDYHLPFLCQVGVGLPACRR